MPTPPPVVIRRRPRTPGAPGSRPHSRSHGRRRTRATLPPPVPPPATTVTVTTDAPSYPIDPAITVTVNIADTAPSTPGFSGYTLEISYDANSGGGATWNTVGTFQPLGPNLFNPAEQFPGVTPSDHCRFRATNNDTTAWGVSNEFALTAE